MSQPRLKVLFDAGPLANGQKSGVGYYTWGLISALAERYPDEIELVGHYFNFLGRKKPDLPAGKNIRYRQSKIIPGKTLALLRRFGLQLPFELLIKERGNLALFPNFVSLPTFLPTKTAIVIHDLCFEDFPQYLQPANRNFLKRFVPGSARRADLVIAVSESTKQSVRHHYKIDSSKIAVTTIPPSAPVKKKVVKPKLDIQGKYLLFVSTLEPRKNYMALARAYSRLPEEVRLEYSLVLAGGFGWQTEEPLAEIERLKSAGNNIVLPGYIDQNTRTFLYQNASLVVMPSHYEGFGMPILEAMSYSLPVAVSDIPVFHEVAGPAAAYFNQDDPDDIAKCLEQLLTSQLAREKLIKMGQTRLKLYSWDKVADDLMERFRTLK